MMESVEWEDDGAALEDWDLEDALARAILGDVDTDGAHAHAQRRASSATARAALGARDPEDDERLIERLHARLFPAAAVTTTTRSTAAVAPFPVTSKLSSRARRPAPVKKADAARQQHRRQADSQIQSVASRTSSVASMSPSKVDAMVRRFRVQADKRARRVRAMQHEAEQAAQHSVASSSPTLSPQSRRLTRHLPSFLERQQAELQARQLERERAALRAEQEQQADRSTALASSVRTPCLCGRADPDADASDAAHTPKCQRFMAMCGTMNASFAIHRKKDGMRRSVDEMMAFHAAKQRKQQALAEIHAAREAQEATFTPQINANSAKIYNDLLQSGRLPRTIADIASRPRHDAVSATGVHAKSPTPRQPGLSTKAKLVLQRRQQRAPQLRQPTRRRSSLASSTVTTRRASITLLPRAAFSESRWTVRPPTAAPDTPRDRKAQPPPLVVPCTIVPFDEDAMGFILANFGVRAPAGVRSATKQTR